MRHLLPLLAFACTTAPLEATQSPPPATLTADIGVMHLGHPSHIRVHDAMPGETLYVIRANSVTPGPCPPAMNGGCVDIGPSAFLLGTMTADSLGLAELVLTPPTSLPDGAPVALQVVALRGGSPVVSQPVARTLTATADHPTSDLLPGSLAITEILTDPTEVGDAAGEWFEVLNTTSGSVDLQGLTIRDDGSNSFTVNDSLLVEAGGRVVFGASTDRAINGGVFVDVDFGGTTLTNSSDEIILSVDGLELDRVAWDDGATFPDVAGVAMQTSTASSNENGAAWCDATSAFGLGDLGTPGLANGICPVPVDIDGDGFSADVDCNDVNPDVNPGALEICDGIDNDCDGATTEDGLVSSRGQNFATLDSAVAAHPSLIDVCGGTYDVALELDYSLTIRGHGDVIFDGNNSNRILGLFPPQDSSGNSSRIYIELSGITFRNGYTTGKGAAISTGSAVTLTLDDTLFENNNADREGGAIAMAGYYWSNQRTALTLVDTVLRNNTSELHGGAIYMGSSQLDATRTQFLDNYAGLDGGAIWGGSNGTVVTLTDSTVHRNHGVRGGGGVQLYSYHNGVLISDNTDWGFGNTGNTPDDVGMGADFSPSDAFFFTDVASFTCEQATHTCQ